MVMKVACIGILIWVGPVHSDVIGKDAEASLAIPVELFRA